MKKNYKALAEEILSFSQEADPYEYANTLGEYGEEELVRDLELGNTKEIEKFLFFYISNDTQYKEEAIALLAKLRN